MTKKLVIPKEDIRFGFAFIPGETIFDRSSGKPHPQTILARLLNATGDSKAEIIRKLAKATDFKIQVATYSQLLQDNMLKVLEAGEDFQPKIDRSKSIKLIAETAKLVFHEGYIDDRAALIKEFKNFYTKKLDKAIAEHKPHESAHKPRRDASGFVAEGRSATRSR